MGASARQADGVLMSPTEPAGPHLPGRRVWREWGGVSVLSLSPHSAGPCQSHPGGSGPLQATKTAGQERKAQGPGRAQTEHRKAAWGPRGRPSVWGSDSFGGKMGAQEMRAFKPSPRAPGAKACES